MRVLISAAIALVMVVAAPACWFGALGRAVADERTPPSSTNNEEHEQGDEGDGEEIVEVIAVRSAPRAQRIKIIDPVVPVPSVQDELLRDHLVNEIHPHDDVSIRRLI